MDEIIEAFDCDNVSSIDPEFRYIELGEYCRIIEKYSQYFESDKMLFILSSDLQNNKQKTVKRVLEFLGVDGEIDSSVLMEDFHKSGTPKIRSINRILSSLVKMPNPIKKALRFIIGSDRIYGFIHRIETEWNVDRKHGKKMILSDDNIQKLTIHYDRDIKFLESLASNFNMGPEKQQRE